MVACITMMQKLEVSTSFSKNKLGGQDFEASSIHGGPRLTTNLWCNDHEENISSVASDQDIEFKTPGEVDPRTNAKRARHVFVSSILNDICNGIFHRIF